MKRFMIALIALLAIALLAGTFAFASIYNGLVFRQEDGATIIERYSGTSKQVIIPVALDDCPVTTIEAGAFVGKNVTAVWVPEGVSFANAFDESTRVYMYSGGDPSSTTPDPDPTAAPTPAPTPEPEQVYLNLPKDTLRIEESAFEGAKEIVRCIVPDGCKSIGSFAFAYSGLKMIDIPDSVKDIDKTAFDGCEDLTIYCGENSPARAFESSSGIKVVVR